ncbi:DUF1538 domain-containing protein [Alkalicella caledoniensis]|uniref:DUF1538 domain-containing protein n=1 Tax=Alkalicella caledoniensis TaxID=2731377 RepID=A0A7G9WAL8_ALKCA|nr:DUF1538 domain-containing protein [Alkalicella caledoniensis]QNO15730.1 DUF1538 domain-containing protein [Alkalicella caledoniensis]
MNLFIEKFKEVLYSVIPVSIIVLVLNFTFVPLPFAVLIRFIIGAVFIILGLTIFLLGVDLGITPLGSMAGSNLTKSNRLWVVVASGIVLGFFISIAEPGLLVLANQIDFITDGQISNISILIVVSLGLAIMVAFGLIRTVFNIPLYKILSILYFLILILSFFATPEFLAIAFDASGATTGVLAVPFILALAIGISSMKKDSKSSEKDSFGLVSIASVGAILSVLILNFFSGATEFSANLELEVSETSSVFRPFFNEIIPVMLESFLAILPLLIILTVLQKIAFKLTKRAYLRILKGFIYAFFGLLLFLVGVNAGFMEVGSIIGYTIASFDNSFYLIIIGFVLGIVTILAEPAVHVLTHQIEDVTSGYVKRVAVLTALAIGVGLAIALSMLRIIIPSIQLWHYLLPGYILAISLTYIVPKLFVGIAFDAGGVATGPMTATFILAFTHGAADAVEGADLLIDGFGMIAMVALTPIITLQILGYIFNIKSKKGGLPENE